MADRAESYGDRLLQYVGWAWPSASGWLRGRPAEPDLPSRTCGECGAVSQMGWLAVDLARAGRPGHCNDIPDAIQAGGGARSSDRRPAALSPRATCALLRRPGRLTERRRTHPARPGSTSRVRRTCLLSSVRSSADISHHTLYVCHRGSRGPCLRRRLDGAMSIRGARSLWTHRGHHEPGHDSRGCGVEGCSGL